MAEVIAHSLFTAFDIDLFKGGKHYRLHDKMGSHPITVDGVDGTYFSVWAPSAKRVSVVGDFNYWNEEEHILNVRWDGSGIWEGFIPEIAHGEVYKYKIHSNHNDVVTEKADPYARRAEHPPQTASVVYKTNHNWKDAAWMKKRHKHNSLNAPYSVYEMHLASWRRKQDEGNRSLSYTELASELVAYVKELNFTHVEFMPVMEHPYDPSWGYQITGYFAPTSRFGYPEELMTLIDALHQNDIGVILDWVPSHFPEDAHGLGNFDGTACYEHPDRKKGWHPDWKSLIFNYERNEVRSFLISNALFWLEQYHVDGLRVDAVASMLYLDYSREEGEWEPNDQGGRENLAVISFLKELNAEVYASFPDVQTIAEESTNFPAVSRPVFSGGLGFGQKWMMGWMHDTLAYFKRDTIYRNHHHNEISFSMTYGFTENFMLPLSHDEVVYGKKSIIGRMPGDEWQRFANLRLLYTYMYTHPGSKLLFMGSEFGQGTEWNFQEQLDWYVLEYDIHKAALSAFKDINGLYTLTPALYEKQFEPEGFEWIAHDDNTNAILSYIRKGNDENSVVVCVFNMTPTPQPQYRIGLPFKGSLREIHNSDASKYAGTGDYHNKKLDVTETYWNGKDHSAEVKIGPLAGVIFELKK
ncbi:1,4-alpha-glucan branching protein GlgB [Dokdonia sp. 4H-3-7-5]|uniref:1,4-alpha-glucan branching protein GlgB n=1 Tax=Dokdonia sp. (strain 4H-3-7-5) TaxID=983548 RepID=UPI00020A7BF6|nr:1,4-alpha-glucan branching protein GlgB [Dokdonia sp. 4H-3-7-5]AEE18268.1 1,4-alpha-glucan branching enzyme [Dokdonia sp. 4H-3-7-5]